MLVFLPLLSRARNCLCGSVPHHGHCPFAGAMEDLFLLLSPSGNANGHGSWGQLRHWNQSVCSGSAMRGVILPAGPIGSAVGRKLNAGILAAPSVDSHRCLFQGVGRTFRSNTWLKWQQCHVALGLVARPSLFPVGSAGPAVPQVLPHCGTEVAQDHPKETEHCHRLPTMDAEVLFYHFPYLRKGNYFLSAARNGFSVAVVFLRGVWEAVFVVGARL